MRHRRLIEHLLRELGDECTRVLHLLARLEQSRAARRDASGILAELSVAVSHLHLHTTRLDDEICTLPERSGPLPPLD